MRTIRLLLISLSILTVAAAAHSPRYTAFVSGRAHQKSATLRKHKDNVERIDSIPNGDYFPHQQPSQVVDSRRSRISLHATQDQATDREVWSLEDLQKYALQEGVELSKSTLGPGFRTVARSSSNSSAILGYGEGFVRPKGDILHLDKMEVFKKMVKQVREENPDFRGGGSTFGVGLLFGYQCLLHGKEAGCNTAEFLAIDDEEFQHKRLVRFYSRSGFEVIKYVGDDLQDIPARMVWGGCGTLMRAKIDDLLPLWTSILIKSAKK